MPDLSQKGAHEFWSQYDNPQVYRVIAFMEGVETWTADGHPELEQAMEQLGRELEQLENVDMGQLAKQDIFIKLACHIKASRVLRILQAIDSAQPGSASKLLIYAEENSKNTDDPAGLFLRRNIVFERLRLLSRVFEPSRTALISKALEGEDHA